MLDAKWQAEQIATQYKSLTYTNYLVVLHLPICGPGDIKKFNTYSPFGSYIYINVYGDEDENVAKEIIQILRQKGIKSITISNQK